MEYRSGNRLPQDNGDRRNFFGILGGTVQGAGLEAARAGYNDGSLIADAAEKGGFTRTAPGWRYDSSWRAGISCSLPLGMHQAPHTAFIGILGAR